MNKWADFLISAVRFDDLKISHFKVHSDEGSKVSGGRTWTREEVIKAISEGKSFRVISKDIKGGWKKGKEVFLVSNNSNYIFTDNRNELADSIKDVGGF